MKELIKKHAKNIRGWRTKRKIIVIESDDWGQVRMPSAGVLQKLKTMGIQTDRCHYVSNDSLASEADIQNLYSLLSSYKGSDGKHPIVTANMIMANPDFRKIRESSYKRYFFETFTQSLCRYPQHKKSFYLMKAGMRNGLFHPQFHGREHVQVYRWLQFLKWPDSDTEKAFDLGVYGLSTSVTSEKRRSYLAAYDIETQDELCFVLDAIREGIDLFQELFGFKPLSAIAPNYIWNLEIEKVLQECGVRYVQGGSVQCIPDPETGANRMIRHYIGEQNSIGQLYLVRNCIFEPSSNPNKDWIDSCLSEIKTAFFWRKPAIIQSHRVNYIGYINPKNRDRNLKLLEELLKRIVNMWPNVEFMASDQLGRLIEEETS